MHVVTHLLIGWTVAEHTTKSPRDRALVTWASVIPDLDGLGLLVDWTARALGGNTGFYEQFHRVALRFVEVLRARWRAIRSPSG
jgi:hypothetical protein